MTDGKRDFVDGIKSFERRKLPWTQILLSGEIFLAVLRDVKMQKGSEL